MSPTPSYSSDNSWHGSTGSRRSLDTVATSLFNNTNHSDDANNSNNFNSKPSPISRIKRFGIFKKTNKAITAGDVTGNNLSRAKTLTNSMDDIASFGNKSTGSVTNISIRSQGSCRNGSSTTAGAVTEAASNTLGSESVLTRESEGNVVRSETGFIDNGSYVDRVHTPPVAKTRIGGGYLTTPDGYHTGYKRNETSPFNGSIGKIRAGNEYKYVEGERGLSVFYLCISSKVAASLGWPAVKECLLNNKFLNYILNQEWHPFEGFMYVALPDGAYCIVNSCKLDAGKGFGCYEVPYICMQRTSERAVEGWPLKKREIFRKFFRHK